MTVLIHRIRKQCKGSNLLLISFIWLRYYLTLSRKLGHTKISNPYHTIISQVTFYLTLLQLFQDYSTITEVSLTTMLLSYSESCMSRGWQNHFSYSSIAPYKSTPKRGKMIWQVSHHWSFMSSTPVTLWLAAGLKLVICNPVKTWMRVNRVLNLGYSKNHSILNLFTHSTFLHSIGFSRLSQQLVTVITQVKHHTNISFLSLLSSWVSHSSLSWWVPSTVFSTLLIISMT